MNQPPAHPVLRVGVVGCGRVGATLGAALRAGGHEVVACSAVSPASRERAEVMLPGVPVLDVPDVVRASDLVLLTVPDDELPGLVDGLAATGIWDEPRVVAHVSGSHGLDVLQPVAERGGITLALHPVLAFTGTPRDLERWPDVVVAVTATADAAMLGQALVIDSGAEPLVVSEDERVLFHTAITHAGDHLTTLVAQSMQVLRDCGADDPARLLRPLLVSAVERALESGDRAAAGAVVRGDAGTVRAHLASLRDQPGDVAEAYRVLARATLDRAVRRSVVPAEKVELLRRAVDDRPSDPRP